MAEIRDSREYDPQWMRDFMENHVKGRENRQKLFSKISSMVLEIIQGTVPENELKYTIREILDQYINHVDVFGKRESDKTILEYLILAFEGEQVEGTIDILSHIDPSLRGVFEDICRKGLARLGVWRLKEDALKDIDSLFAYTKAMLLYARQNQFCCNSKLHDPFTIKSFALEMAEKVNDLKAYTNQNILTRQAYPPEAKHWLIQDVGRHLEYIENVAISIHELDCCIRVFDADLLADETIQDLAIVISEKVYDEILMYLDRSLVIFHGADLPHRGMDFTNYVIEALINTIHQYHDLSDIVPLLEIFGNYAMATKLQNTSM